MIVFQFVNYWIELVDFDSKPAFANLYWSKLNSIRRNANRN